MAASLTHATIERLIAIGHGAVVTTLHDDHRGLLLLHDPLAPASVTATCRLTDMVEEEVAAALAGRDPRPAATGRPWWEWRLTDVARLDEPVPCRKPTPPLQALDGLWTVDHRVYDLVCEQLSLGAVGRG